MSGECYEENEGKESESWKTSTFFFNFQGINTFTSFKKSNNILIGVLSQSLTLGLPIDHTWSPAASRVQSENQRVVKSEWNLFFRGCGCRPASEALSWGTDKSFGFIQGKDKSQG